MIFSTEGEKSWIKFFEQHGRKLNKNVTCYSGFRRSTKPENRKMKKYFKVAKTVKYRSVGLGYSIIQRKLRTRNLKRKSSLC